MSRKFIGRVELSDVFVDNDFIIIVNELGEKTFRRQGRDVLAQAATAARNERIAYAVYKKHQIYDAWEPPTRRNAIKENVLFAIAAFWPVVIIVIIMFFIIMFFIALT